jgi:hypothetical protein
MARVVCKEPDLLHQGGDVLLLKSGDREIAFTLDKPRYQAISEEISDAEADRLATLVNFEKLPAPDQGAPAGGSDAGGGQSAQAAGAQPVPGDTNGDGKLSTAEKRAAAKKPPTAGDAAPPA